MFQKSGSGRKLLALVLYWKRARQNPAAVEGICEALDSACFQPAGCKERQAVNNCKQAICEGPAFVRVGGGVRPRECLPYEADI